LFGAATVPSRFEGPSPLTAEAMRVAVPAKLRLSCDTHSPPPHVDAENAPRPAKEIRGIVEVRDEERAPIRGKRKARQRFRRERDALAPSWRSVLQVEYFERFTRGANQSVAGPHEFANEGQWLQRQLLHVPVRQAHRAQSERAFDEEETLAVTAQKLRADATGIETATPMNDLIEVGVFAAGKNDPFSLSRQRIHTGKQTIRIIVPQEPSRAGVDPYRKLIERERGDNVVDVKTGG
jgi:hypothetical protein